jgi:hypothetical protein
MVKMQIKILVSSVFLFCLTSSAHQAGHGPLINKRGPHGGAVTAVVEAREADRGREAKTVYLLEHVTDKGDYRVFLLDLSGKQLAKGIESAKFILVSRKNDKDEIHKVEQKSESLAFIRVPESLRGLSDLKTAEIILMKENVKYVADLPFDALARR